MASKDLGSAVSLLQAGGDVIPKEYHRRVLKKIAQLTKVIYALHTKNDEHEDFVSKLRSQHETEKQQLLSDCSARLQNCEEKLSGDLKVREKIIVELKGSLSMVEKEREEFQQVQVSYRKQTEDQLALLNSEHTKKLQSVTTQLERLRSEQTQQLKEVGKLQEQLTKKTNEQMNTLRKSHEREMSDIRESSKRDISKLENELATLRSLHQKEMSDLKTQHQIQLEAQKQKISSTQSELLTTEKKKSEEREELLREEYSRKEEQLKHQISVLSNDLRAARDRAALAEQKIKELESQFEENQVGASGLKARLLEAEQKTESLKATVSSLKNELDIAQEQYKQQSLEMNAKSATLGKLEALRVSNEGVIENLRSQITLLQQKLQQLDSEREALQTSQRNSSEEQSVRIKTLERELDKMRREKQELHAQFAREIEAAHAQLGQQETQLASEHLKTLQELRDQHKEALIEAERERKQALEDLRAKMLSEGESDLEKAQEQFESELSSIKELLRNKTTELDLALEELKMLKSKVSKGEEHLGSAAGQIESLRAENSQLQRELKTSHVHLEESKKEKQHLKSTLDSLKHQQQDLKLNHQKELKEVKSQLKRELDDSWRERLKQECASLRRELSQRHNEDSNAALSELASLKDTAMKQAREQWDTERVELLNKIDELERRLNELQHSTAASLEEAKASSSELVTTLRQEIESVRTKHESVLKSLQESHHKEILSLKEESSSQKHSLEVELTQQHTANINELHQANQIAVSALREQLREQKEEELRESVKRQRETFEALQAHLVSQHQDELDRLRGEHGSEVEIHRKQLQELLEERKNEQLNHQSTVADLASTIEGRDKELTKLRDKVNTLTVKLNEVKKELEVKGHEVIMVEREAKSRIRYREEELSVLHQTEVDSLHSQYRQQSQLLLTDFNKAKALLNTKIQDMERELALWQQRYQSRDSKPEDVQAIRELKIIVRQQEQKMKELIAEKRIYQLELMNREKNYNKIFNANPHIGVLDPLQLKHKKQPIELPSLRHSSAPSLVSPGSPDILAPFPTPRLPPPVVPPIGSGGPYQSPSSSSTYLPKKEHVQHSTLEGKPRKLVMLGDSPLTQQKHSKTSKSRTLVDDHAVQPIKQKQPQAANVHKHSMVVQ